MLSASRNKRPFKRYRVVAKSIGCIALNRNLEITVFRIPPLIHNRHHFDERSFQPEAPGGLLPPPLTQNRKLSPSQMEKEGTQADYLPGSSVPRFMISL